MYVRDLILYPTPVGIQEARADKTSQAVASDLHVPWEFIMETYISTLGIIQAPWASSMKTLFDTLGYTGYVGV